MKFLFWLLIAADAAVLLVFFVLGLAAATSTRQGGLAVVFSPPFLVPALLLATAVVLFLRAPSPLWRSVALLLAAAPALVLVYWKGSETLKLRQNTNSRGELASFREGPLRELADAIRANDTLTVARLAPSVDIDARGYMDMTLLMLAIRQLEQHPADFTNLRIILAAGANPNLASTELPLAVAIQQSRKTGVEPTVMLLNAGANPNAKTQFGAPVFFAGTYSTVPAAILEALLDHGADVKITDKDGRSIVFAAALANSWEAVLLLLERGADYQSGRTINGESFQQMVESHARVYGDTAGVREVLEFLQQHPDAPLNRR